LPGSVERAAGFDRFGGGAALRSVPGASTDEAADTATRGRQQDWDRWPAHSPGMPAPRSASRMLASATGDQIKALPGL
jgi:hypothetical protein